ncbi:hypothetical protein WR25_00280 [Diploscapter pachys]|uniref:Plastocyanin-like domain-containing protein n=1 Tax=Diploscapter pachys TaxID=2018661 RepID=A0A2A2J4M1_9BILA|nr:hypothetical protein WR25_00280 [Diploscapter pachys]
MHYGSHMDNFRFQFPTGIPYYHSDNLDLISTNCSTVNCPKDAAKDDRNCRCFYYKKHKLGNIVQLTIYNMGNGGGMGTGYAHPIHIHGTHFYVMKVGWPTYNASGFIDKMNPDMACPGDTADCNLIGWADNSWNNGAVQGMNTKNPSRRDTITLPAGGYIVIRFRALNPGWWFAHCHLELHLMDGTGWAYKVGDDDQIYMPPDNFPKDCGVFILDKRNLCLSGPIRADVGSFLPTNSGQAADRLGSTRIELPIWAERHTDRQFTELPTRPDPPG